MRRIAELADLQSVAVERLRSDTRISNARSIGTIAAFDLAAQRDGYLSDIALPLRDACRKRGALIRPLGGTVYVMPPYCTTEAELRNVFAAISDAIGEVAP